MKVFLLVVVAIVLLVALTIYLFQAQLIYYPQRYSPRAKALEEVDRLSYISGGKKQFIYLVKRDQSGPPDKVWWFFNGNGSVALNWVELLKGADPANNHAYALFDYPGYGFNGGRPHPERIRQSVDDAIPVVAGELSLDETALKKRSNTLGHSLGCAVAFDTAQRHGMGRVVAISPFTSMRAMAKKQFNSVFAALLRHPYDNEAPVKALLDREGGVQVDIFHGDQDGLIPIEMSKSLAAMDASGEMIRHHPVPGAGHNGIVPVIRDELLAILNGD